MPGSIFDKLAKREDVLLLVTAIGNACLGPKCRSLNVFLCCVVPAKAGIHAELPDLIPYGSPPARADIPSKCSLD